MNLRRQASSVASYVMLNNMRIAVTGASGFIGTELLDELNKQSGVEIVGLTRGSVPVENTANVIWKTTDYSRQSLVVALEGADAVIHLAAVRGTTTNREDYIINETMTESVLQAMSDCKVGRIVFASTISVYDDVDTIPWKEDYPLSPRTMYGDSKIACEKLIGKYAGTHGFDYSIVRIAQVLGLGEKRRGMMNVFLDTAAAGGEITVIGKSEAKRQYIYVKDLVKIISKLAMQQPGNSQILNVGMPNAYTNLEIAQIVNKVYGNATAINYDDSKAETIKASCMSIDKLRSELDYEPLDMEEAIRQIKA